MAFPPDRDLPTGISDLPRSLGNLPFSAVEFAANPEPRCPCVLILDTSASMAGARIAELQSGLSQFRDELLADPLARKRVEVTVVTFGGTVRMPQDFATADAWQVPSLTAEGLTPMGQAIQTAMSAVEQRKQVYKGNGISYYRPWLFLITDGEPNDEWQAAARALRDSEQGKQVAFFAVGVAEANMDVLRLLSVRTPLQLRGLQFRDMFQWLSSSLKSVSHSGLSEEVALDNPAGPEGWAKV
jgi:uncharacterized protein YegL